MRFTKTLFQAFSVNFSLRFDISFNWRLQFIHSTWTFSHIQSTTGLAGLPVHPNPRPHLISTYNATLSAVSRLPATAVYRQAVESATQHRLSIVNSTENINEIEDKIDAGQIEEVILQAEDELRLVAKMEEWKAWEPLEVPIPKGQWDSIYGVRFGKQGLIY